jgi:hypothetical protein
MSSTAKTTYRITNWSQYNESLVRRGDVTFWFDEEVIAAWKHGNAERKVGRPFVYSDLAIESLLMLRELFRLPYRQTEGQGRTLVRLLQATSPSRLHVVGQTGRQDESLASERPGRDRTDRRRGRQYRSEVLRRRGVEGPAIRPRRQGRSSMLTLLVTVG